MLLGSRGWAIREVMKGSARDKSPVTSSILGVARQPSAQIHNTLTSAITTHSRVVVFTISYHHFFSKTSWIHGLLHIIYLGYTNTITARKPLSIIKCQALSIIAQEKLFRLITFVWTRNIVSFLYFVVCADSMFSGSFLKPLSHLSSPSAYCPVF